jgi:lipopolysaccharide export system protein LptA
MAFCTDQLVASPRLTILVPIAVAVLVIPAEAADSVVANKNCNEPIHVEADTMSADMNANTVTYDGNVLIKQCDIRIRANRVKVNTTASGKEASTVEATGNVVANSPTSGTGTGDNGVYDVQNHVVDLTGRRVVLTNGNGATITGTRLAVNLTTGVAKVVSSGSRVQGVFTNKPGPAMSTPAPRSESPK